MKKKILYLAMCLFAITFFSACEKDKFSDELPINPLDPVSDSLVYEITSSVGASPTTGNFNTHINFAFYSTGIAKNKKALKFVLYRDDVLISSVGWNITRIFDDKVYTPGTYKYEIALEWGGLYSKKSKPYYITCN